MNPITKADFQKALFLIPLVGFKSHLRPKAIDNPCADMVLLQLYWHEAKAYPRIEGVVNLEHCKPENIEKHLEKYTAWRDEMMF